MLVPHSRENAHFGKTRLTADNLENARVLVGLEAMGLDQFGRDCWVLHLNGIPFDPDADSLGHQAHGGKGQERSPGR